MPPTNETAAPVSAEDITLYVAMEISRKTWVLGVKSPASEKISLHSLGPADKEGLRDLVEKQRAKAEQALDQEVRVLCCYEAGYEGFWLARWLEQEMSIETVVLDPATQLYGNICRIVPPPLAVKPCEDQNWSLDNFRWSTPVGGMDNVPDFLEFRREHLGELFDKRHAALRTD